MNSTATQPLNQIDKASGVINRLLANTIDSMDDLIGRDYYIKNPRLVCELTTLAYQEYRRMDDMEYE